ncbi:MAG: hypothetical protein KatS3mg109_2043 [Pirellulaceae bacterium]|nr:MAG: hypothetical protein KatS3mg109_2043 [Pirellulaceae bacterium]
MPHSEGVGVAEKQRGEAIFKNNPAITIRIPLAELHGIKVGYTFFVRHREQEGCLKLSCHSITPG